MTCWEKSMLFLMIFILHNFSLFLYISAIIFDNLYSGAIIKFLWDLVWLLFLCIIMTVLHFGGLKWILISIKQLQTSVEIALDRKRWRHLFVQLKPSCGYGIDKILIIMDFPLNTNVLLKNKLLYSYFVFMRFDMLFVG